MNIYLRNSIIAIAILMAVLGIWYFSSIVAYILVSAVLALIGKPIVDVLGKLKIKNYAIPKPIRSLIAISIFWLFLYYFFRIFIPLIAGEVDSLSTIEPDKILESLKEPIHHMEIIIDKYKIFGVEDFTVEKFLTQKALTIFNFTFLSEFFSSLAGLLGNLFIALFSISFITFFFLKDDHLFNNALLSVVPDKFEDALIRALNSIRILLMRYFLGILAQVTGIFTLVTIGMVVIGVGVSHSLIIALIAALLTIIPYIGPIIGSAIGIILGIATHLDIDFQTQLLPLIFKMLCVFGLAHLVDNFVFQPLIFSNSVKAHPLEIFIVIMMAGSLAGVTGMILAIPGYTVLRVFGKEFFNNFKVVKKLTKNI